MQQNQRTRSPDPRDREVGARIRAQRLMRKMSQEELGEQLGITFQQIQKYEKGTNRVAAGRLIRISEVLGVPVGFFLEGTASTKSAPSQDTANSALSFLKTAGAVRLLRAYNRIEATDVRQAMVQLAEQIASRSSGRSGVRRGAGSRSY